MGNHGPAEGETVNPRRVIITGASRGIGRGIASVLAGEGFHVGLLARSAEGLKEVEESICSRGGTCVCAPCDLRDPVQTGEAISRLVSLLGGVDGLINNAGLVLRKDVFSISVEEWKNLMETNVNGLFFATRAVLPFMKEEQSGHIINISSIAGRLPLAGGSGYAASKYAVTGFSESLFLEVRDYGIKVTIIFPGGVDISQPEREPAPDSDSKICPADVARACRDALMTSPSNCLSSIEIRSLKRPKKN